MRVDPPEALPSTVRVNLGDMVPDRISEEYDLAAGLSRYIPCSSYAEGDVSWRDLTRRFLYAGLPSNSVL